MPENFNKPFDDHSNAAMSHTSEERLGRILLLENSI